jgi:hypothetical protein
MQDNLKWLTDLEEAGALGLDDGETIPETIRQEQQSTEAGFNPIRASPLTTPVDRSTCGKADYSTRNLTRRG